MSRVTPTTPPGPLFNKRGVSPLKKFIAGQIKLADVALRLYSLGFNVVPVDSEKKPIGSWRADRRLEWGELKKRLAKAEGLAITGRLLADNEDYGVAVFDIDDPARGEEVLKQVFGDNWKTRLCGQSWSFCGLTGPRPKNKVKCKCEKPGQDCDCINTETGERRKLSELPRGMYVIVKVPKQCIPSGTIRSEAVEIMVSNYEVVYGRHPSGAFYETVRYDKNSGKWVSVDYRELGPGEPINCNELKLLVALISGAKRQATANEAEVVQQQTDGEVKVAANLPEPTKELSDREIARIVNLVRPIYWIESDEGGHYHDNLLFGLSCLMRRAGVKYESARKVVETIINVALQDIAGKVGETELKRIMEVEQEHINETVEWVYKKIGYDPNRKCWGRSKFREKLTSAIAKAIDEGLIAATSPKAWFKAIYRAFGLAPVGKGEGAATGGQPQQGQQREGGGNSNAVSNVDVEKQWVLRHLPPSSYDLTKLPPWVWKFEVKPTPYCISDDTDPEEGRIECLRWLKAASKEDSQYIVVFTEKPKYVRVKDDNDPDAPPRFKLKYTRNEIGILPRFMGYVYDPFFDEWYLVAFKNGKLIKKDIADNFDAFINGLSQIRSFSVVQLQQYLNKINTWLPEVEMVISVGLSEDGFIDPYLELDLTDYGVEPLITAYQWIKSTYPEGNVKWAWFNVMAVLGKIIASPVKYFNDTFHDYIIYNVGKGKEGKTTLARYVLTPLLGGRVALKSKYLVRLDGSVRTEAQMANLISLNRLPLILDEQRRGDLINNVGLIISSAVGMGTVKIHASRYGPGEPVEFKNLRGMIVFTNTPLKHFIQIAQVEASDFAIERRIIELVWDRVMINPSGRPDIKPIYGFATRLWLKYKDEFKRANDLLELIEMIVKAIKSEYPNDPAVAEIAKFTVDIISELRGRKKIEEARMQDDEVILIENARAIYGRDKSNIQLLRDLLEDPARAGIVFVRPKDERKLGEFAESLFNEIERIKSMYSIVTEQPPDSSSNSSDPDRIVSAASEDAKVIYSILRDHHRNGKVEVFVEVGGLVRNTQRQFLGAYITKRNEIPGYYIPLARLVKAFIEKGKEEEESEPPVNDNDRDHQQ